MAEGEDKPRILVTGGSGFIATHVIKMLAHQGYPVRATVRSLAKEEKVKPIRDLAPEDNPVELVEAELSSETAWLPAVQGCTYVLHIASPFPFDSPKDEMEVIGPAVNGVLNVLKACQEAGGVKRVVLTSSMAAVNAGYNTRDDRPWNESDFTDPAKLRNPQDAYLKSKTLAEIEAWNFSKALPDEEKIELVVINPGVVLGPNVGGANNSSMKMLSMLLNKETPFIARLGFALVDVRDVAQAHINAMTVPEAAGNRHILVSKSLWFKEIAEILKAEFDPQGYSIPTMEMPDFVIKFTSIFNKQSAAMVPLLGSLPEFDNSRMKNVLGVPGREAKATILDMAYRMIETGVAKKTTKYTGPKYSETDE